jgi:CheY-like chemotaxis protein
MDVLTSHEPRRVLAVDDEPRTLRVVARLLEQAQMFCHTVSSGDAALAFLKDSRDIDVVVSDLRMPSMDGSSSCERFGASTPIGRGCS